jgi:hypothetical protein
MLSKASKVGRKAHLLLLFRFMNFRLHVLEPPRSGPQQKSNGKLVAILFTPRITTIRFALALLFFGFEAAFGGPSAGASRTPSFLRDQGFLETSLQKVYGSITITRLRAVLIYRHFYLGA